MKDTRGEMLNGNVQNENHQRGARGRPERPKRGRGTSEKWSDRTYLRVCCPRWPSRRHRVKFAERNVQQVSAAASCVTSCGRVYARAAIGPKRSGGTRHESDTYARDGAQRLGRQRSGAFARRVGVADDGICRPRDRSESFISRRKKKKQLQDTSATESARAGFVR